MKKFLLLVTVVLMACAFTISNATAKTIRIGLMCPLTGAYASEGQDMKRIVTLLAKEVNARGGIRGDKVKIILADDGSDARTSSMAAQKLTTKGIVAVIGTYGSSNTEATQNIYDESEIIQVATGSTSVRLTEKGLKYFFRTSPRDDSQGLVAFKAIEAKQVRKVAVLHDNSSYSKGLADEIVKHLRKTKIKVVFEDALTPKENDYTVILTKMKAARPDFIFFTGYFGEAGLLLKQKREMNWDVPLMGGDATNNTDLVKIAGRKAAAGFECISPLLPGDLTDRSAKQFMKNYKARYNSLPNSIWSVLAGDAFKVIVEAIKATGSTDPDKMADYMHNDLKDVPGLTGKISFNKKGDRIGDVYRVYKINSNGEFILK